ncbi:MAG: LytTR family DNA-binding domain-containing protein [Bacteroidales bacterium]
MLRTIIVDDEPHMRQTLNKLLQKHCPNVKIVDMAGSVSSGLESIRKHHPDLVLLDIKMDDGTGFDLLRQAEPIDFKIIFITAYDQYAVEAFRFSALDYLLKPIIPAYLAGAVYRAEEQKIRDLEIQLGNLKNNLGTQDVSKKKIILKTLENIHILAVEDILYCASDSNYTTFYLANSNQIVVSKTLKEYEDLLKGSGFFRVHKSFLVNLSKINRLEKSEGGNLIMSNNEKIPIGASRKEQLMELFEQLAD